MSVQISNVLFHRKEKEREDKKAGKKAGTLSTLFPRRRESSALSFREGFGAGVFFTPHQVVQQPIV